MKFTFVGTVRLLAITGSLIPTVSSFRSESYSDLEARDFEAILAEYDRRDHVDAADFFSRDDTDELPVREFIFPRKLYFLFKGYPNGRTKKFGSFFYNPKAIDLLKWAAKKAGTIDAPYGVTLDCAGQNCDNLKDFSPFRRKDNRITVTIITM